MSSEFYVGQSSGIVYVDLSDSISEGINISRLEAWILRQGDTEMKHVRDAQIKPLGAGAPGYFAVTLPKECFAQPGEFALFLTDGNMSSYVEYSVKDVPDDAVPTHVASYITQSGRARTSVMYWGGGYPPSGFVATVGKT